MASQMCAYIGAFDLILFAWLVADDDGLDASGPSQKRHGIADRPRRCPATVPANHDVVQLERRFLDIRNDDERFTGIEQRGFDNVLFDRVGSRLRLPDNGEVEAPRDLTELSPALTKLALSVSGSTLTPARAAAVVKLSRAASTAAWLCRSITSSSGGT